MQVCPELRNLQIIAPATAASRSASSKTRNGALPPSSSETFLTWPAHCAIRSLPTSVEPVKPSLRTIGFEVSSPPISGASAAEPVTIERMPRGTPGALGELGERERRERRLLGRLDDHRAACRERRRGLARDHRGGEVPRGDAGGDADRLLGHDDAHAVCGRRDHVAVGALRLLAEPLEERGGVGDLALRLGERLALLARQQQREVVHVLVQQVVPAAQHVCALLRGLRAPGGLRGLGGLDRAPRLGGAAARHLGEQLARRGVQHLERVARVGVDPVAVDVGLRAEERPVGERERSRWSGSSSVPSGGIA